VDTEVHPCCGCRELLEGANELRVMVCKDKVVPGAGKKGVQIVAACGKSAL